ncbi:MAG: reverse transcriptase-like protein [Flavobacteriaceae bacterium]|nr:reverse transcriptase-like protein [Flavobacteriaceae bacterium]MCY4267455.1 reverse transcriptase-like protein [Flavobacteriaceae bacterium]MCY4299139.1 reverse transcriptase-like protein [Flavobacteriaceae bacterium]
MIGEAIIYSDGGCINNPGPGAYGVVLETKTNSQTESMELMQAYQTTTNNRMELMGVIIGLKKVKDNKVVDVYTDSRYVVDAINKEWVFQWEKKEFKNRTNADLWRRLLKVYRQLHQVKFHWVKSHDANPRNERCHQLATLAIKKKNKIRDTGYEKRIKKCKGIMLSVIL